MTQQPWVEANRRHWDTKSASYQADHRDLLGVAPDAWGMLRVPESQIKALGEVAGRDVLEYGCGAAQWSIALAKRGARPVGLDISERQLDAARTEMEAAGVDFPLICSPGESVPLPDASFDVVLSDGGVMSWADPLSVLPEAGRLLRPGGLLAFCVASAFGQCHWGVEDDHPGNALVRGYFGLGAQPLAAGARRFTLPHGEWVRLLVDSGFEIERLWELRLEGEPNKFWVGVDWPRHWPLEEVWLARHR